MKFTTSLYLIPLLVFFSCNTTLSAQQQKKKIAKPKFGDVAYSENKTTPNTLTINAKILGKSKQVLNCNKKNVNAVLCKILKVSNEGSSIINLPQSNKTLYFNTETQEIFNALSVMKGTTLELHLKEEICKKGKKSNYTILGFTPKTKS
ncbi:hypothetical protein [uncultured Tenacibaculum sp.]|uniref:hypothetical protein n=1 Tax=uncultured Tenacibaculum sp. TaxID=174713 RepID=UPI002601B5A7|nr:hypothetical protein [uncultured Tenacibaculum sp.]